MEFWRTNEFWIGAEWRMDQQAPTNDGTQASEEGRVRLFWFQSPETLHNPHSFRTQREKPQGKRIEWMVEWVVEYNLDGIFIKQKDRVLLHIQFNLFPQRMKVH